MTLRVRRLGSGLAALLLVLAALAALPAASYADGSAPGPGQRSSSPTTVLGQNNTRYCVDGYKPHSDVRVTDNGDPIATIHTNSHGHGCMTVHLGPGCHDLVAHGVNSNGRPVTSSTRVCVESLTQTRGSTLPFTGADIIPWVGIGAALLAAGIVLVTAVRRHRSGRQMLGLPH